jgi:hypothetical protein
MELPSSQATEKITSQALPSPQISNAPMLMAIACLLVIVALVLGVGLASNLVLRHLVQTLPLWLGVVFGFRGSRATAWMVLPLFLFWFLLMTVIWAYLLGFSHLINGHFSGVEIAMTVIVGVAAAIGITSCARFRSSLSPLVAAVLFIGMGAIQLVCFRVSFLPAIAHR